MRYDVARVALRALLEIAEDPRVRVSIRRWALDRYWLLAWRMARQAWADGWGRR